MFSGVGVFVVGMWCVLVRMKCSIVVGLCCCMLVLFWIGGKKCGMF